MTVRELREKMEGIPDFYNINVIREYGSDGLEERGSADVIDTEIHNQDCTFTLTI